MSYLREVCAQEGRCLRCLRFIEEGPGTDGIKCRECGGTGRRFADPEPPRWRVVVRSLVDWWRGDA